MAFLGGITQPQQRVEHLVVLAHLLSVVLVGVEEVGQVCVTLAKVTYGRLANTPGLVKVVARVVTLVEEKAVQETITAITLDRLRAPAFQQTLREPAEEEAGEAAHRKTWAEEPEHGELGEHKAVHGAV